MLNDLALSVTELLPKPATQPRSWTLEAEPCVLFNSSPAAALTDGARRVLIGQDSPDTLIVAGHYGHAVPFPIGDYEFVRVDQAAPQRIASAILRTILPDLDQHAARTEGSGRRLLRRMRAQHTLVLAVPEGAIASAVCEGQSLCWTPSPGTAAKATVNERGDMVTITAGLTLATVERALPVVLPHGPSPWTTLNSVYGPVARRLIAAHHGLRTHKNEDRPGTDIIDTTELGYTAVDRPLSVALKLPVPQRATPTARVTLTTTTGLDLATALIPKLSH
ncbi:hypothetical protein ACIOGZ_28945 [Kitasatospora sp. NPDC088160]|uniref:hypothetical protein n=1 Tax=Kitasatospora sp. NPDC088160 TaxID=3364072 RepID=UPI00382D92FE